MPVRKTPVKKKPAAKSAAPALAKKVASAKTKKSASTVDKPSAKKDAPKDVAALAKNVAGAISSGKFDGHLGVIDDALTARSNEQRNAAKKSAPAEKKGRVTEAPKREKKDEVIVPKVGTTYKVKPSFKKLAGAKVKFKKFRAESNDEKAVVEMVTEKPGFPKGKNIVIPVSALSTSR